MGKKLGELLLEHGLLTPEQLKEAMVEQEHTGAKIGDVIIRRGLLKVDDIEEVLSRQFATPSINLANYMPSPQVLSLIPEWYVRENLVVPVSLKEKTLTVAVADPRDFRIIDELGFMTGKRISPVVAAIFSLKEAINGFYGEPTDGFEEESSGTDDFKIPRSYKSYADIKLPEIFSGIGSLPKKDAMNALLKAADSGRFSHLHFFRVGSQVTVKIRRSGRLEGSFKPPVHPAMELLQFIKSRAGILTREGDPFKGTFRIQHGESWFSVSISGMPFDEGEHIVLELTKAKNGPALHLKDLGMTTKMLSTYKGALKRDFGLFLYVAPILSGTTTTMHATLRDIKSRFGLSMAYEAPAKDFIEGVIHIDPSQTPHLDPIDGLRVLLAQDADLILIGDISSPEAMRAAIQASLGGALVLARAKDTSPFNFITRMARGGISPTLMASAIVGVMGQRLLDRLCPHCSREYVPTSRVKEEVEEMIGLAAPQLMRASGCKECAKTGKLGKIGAFELITNAKLLQKIIMEELDDSKVRELAAKEGINLIHYDAAIKAVEGLVSFEQVKGTL